MKSMVGPENGEQCPFEFNFDPATFKAGDMVSYRVTGSLSEFPFVGVLIEVHRDHVVLAHADGSPLPQGPRMRGTRESRPVVAEKDALSLALDYCCRTNAPRSLRMMGTPEP